MEKLKEAFAKLQFDPKCFVTNLKYMAIGMLGIFIIVGVIMAATYLTAYITDKVVKPSDD